MTLMDPANSAVPTSGGTARWSRQIDAAARETGVPAALIHAVMLQESGGNQHARSPVGARGLMQFMPGTAAAMGINPDDPAQAIMGGARYLAQHYAKFGNWVDAIAAYNGGPGANKRSKDKGHEHQRLWQNPNNWKNADLSKPQGSSYGQTAHYVQTITNHLNNSQKRR